MRSEGNRAAVFQRGRDSSIEIELLVDRILNLVLEAELFRHLVIALVGAGGLRFGLKRLLRPLQRAVRAKFQLASKDVLDVGDVTGFVAGQLLPDEKRSPI